jgi:hypothetical protein
MHLYVQIVVYNRHHYMHRVIHLNVHEDDDVMMNDR